LLVAAWPPSSGTVRLDGADIGECDPDWLGRFMGYLPQDIELFPGTVAENIARLGDAQAHAEAVIAAAQKAGAHEMILHLPEGYDTTIGDNGVMLSGGQVQRVALARALFNNPCLVILDEPNSNLDSEGEDALIRAMRILKNEGVTVLVITHKPSLLADFDKIMLLRDGSVEMFGPRQEVFNRLVPQQAAPAPAV
jgi:ABC-type protease/lipase transport system fused ATPase/permease subunit